MLHAGLLINRGFEISSDRRRDEARIRGSASCCFEGFDFHMSVEVGGTCASQSMGLCSAMKHEDFTAV